MIHIFRNSTVELLFNNFESTFSDYGDISRVPDAELYIWFYTALFDNGIIIKPQIINNYIEKLELLISNISESKTIILFTMANIFDLQWQQVDFTLKDKITNYNKFLISIASSHDNVKVIDFEKFASEHECMIDWKYYYISGTEINPKLAKMFSAWLRNQMDGINLMRKKCLILDLDNTLWGGVLGEDGLSGIKLGEDYPGKAFRDFQKLILKAKENGVVLAICSKNNEEDVEQLFDEHPNMVLKKNDFSSLKINWNDKATNIKEISNELNIGLESFVFFDDNPRERDLVKGLIPEVSVPDFPENAYQLPIFFKKIYEQYFLIYKLTDEDKNKTKQYLQNIQREKLKAKFTDLDSYIETLNIEIEIYKADKYNIPRIAQMTQKTNQFNLTTHRYTESDILNFKHEGAEILCAAVKDKFGENGITSLAIAKPMGDKKIKIDTFLMSCRILGKKIEIEFMKYILNYFRKSGYCNVYAEYIPTFKNKQTESFYEKIGFKLIQDENKIKSYKIKLKSDLKINKNYEIKEMF